MRMAWLTRRLPPLSQPVPSVLAGGGGDRGGAVEAGEAGLCWGWRRMLPTSPMMLAAPRWLIPTSPVSPVPIASSCCLISRSSCFSSMLSGGSVRFGAGASRAREARSRREQPFGPPAGYFRSYDLRHTCATLLLYQGRTVNEVAEHLGRTHPASPAHLRPRHARRLEKAALPITERSKGPARGAPPRTPWATCPSPSRRTAELLEYVEILEIRNSPCVFLRVPLSSRRKGRVRNRRPPGGHARACSPGNRQLQLRSDPRRASPEPTYPFCTRPEPLGPSLPQ